jgi:hypothetical protein
MAKGGNFYRLIHIFLDKKGFLLYIAMWLIIFCSFLTLKSEGMKKQRVLKNKRPKFIKIFFVLIAVCFSMVNCNKNDDEPPVFVDEIAQPLNPNDPAVLPEVKIVIQKLDVNFTPLLTSVVANWRVKSHKQYVDNGCWSDWVETKFDGVTREGLKGKNVKYPGCGVYIGGTWTPDFSETSSSVWGQYKKGQEILDGEKVHSTPGGTVNFYRYYTVPDLPDAYIMMERRWEVLKIEGSDYAHCQGCSSLEKTTTTTTGIAEGNTEKWGYTLGLEWSLGASIEFVEASAKFSATVMQEFSTSITKTEEHTEEIKCVGTLPSGKSIIRLQAFREISNFKLVNQDGTAYGNGVYCPEIETTTQIKNYAWYY